jgi:hypothetical protein
MGYEVEKESPYRKRESENEKSDSNNMESGRTRHTTLYRTRESLPPATVVWLVSWKHRSSLAGMISDQAFPRPVACMVSTHARETGSTTQRWWPEGFVPPSLRSPWRPSTQPPIANPTGRVRLDSCCNRFPIA